MHGADHQRDIARAIRRSRKARARIRARKRRIALGAIAAIALGGAGTLSISGVTGTDLARAAVTQASSLADLLNARSPGERTQAQLTKTKRVGTLARSRPRTVERRKSPNEPTIEAARLLTSQPVAPGLEQPLPMAAISTPPSLDMIVTGGGGGGGGVLPPTGGGGVLPPGGGGGPATFPTSEPRQPITVPSPLPEPGTWATMLLGFGFIGWRVRRRSKSRGARQPA